MTEYTRYRCVHCGWEGDEPHRWEEKPRDEFEIMCPECHHTDDVFMLLRDDGKWIPYKSLPYIDVPYPVMTEKTIDKLQSILTANNVYFKTDLICDLTEKKKDEWEKVRKSQ